MSATDELRRLLDERGVEYTVVPEDMYSREYIKIGSMEILTNDRDEVAVYYLTPEQAVDATLGRETCRVVSSMDMTDAYEYAPTSYWHFEMTCGGVFDWTEPEPPSFCPCCGAKVVDV